MSRLHVLDSGVLYLNPDPAHRHVSAFFPNVVPLSESELVCLYQRGDGIYAVNSTVALLRSVDGGATWADEGYLYPMPAEGGPCSYHGTFLSRLADGTLVAFPFRADRADPGQSFFSQAGGLIPNEPVLLFSGDGGRTWTEPAALRLPAGMLATPAQGVVELTDGTWLATFDQWPAYGDPGPYRPRMLALSSRDRGRSWSEPAVMADGAGEGKGFWHGRAIRLQDGRLYALFWAADMTQAAQGPVDLSLHYAFADPTGLRWDRPRPTDLPGQTSCAAQLADGRLAAIYTWRQSEQPGFMVALSDDGRTWDLSSQVRVWDATGWTHIGLSSPDRYPRSHDTIAFGAPSLTVILGGDLLASWWCTHASLTHCRWARLAVAD
ncbi:MAG: sialidase family protein [Candidatus Latescibacterota bacterium]|jgi:hypothetical protein